MKREPLLTAAGITAVVSALLGALVAFGLDLTDEQTSAVLAVVAVLAPLAVGLAARGKVTPSVDPRTDDGVPLRPHV